MVCIQVGMVQMYLVTWAVQLESATRVTMVRQLDIVLAYVVQVTPPRPAPPRPAKPRQAPPHPSPVQVAVFGLVPGWAEALGSLLVILTVASIPLQSSSPRPPPTTEECDDSD